jgi:hypothetical protein
MANNMWLAVAVGKLEVIGAPANSSAERSRCRRACALAAARYVFPG